LVVEDSERCEGICPIVLNSLELHLSCFAARSIFAPRAFVKTKCFVRYFSDTHQNHLQKEHSRHKSPHIRLASPCIERISMIFLSFIFRRTEIIDVEY